ncbi:2TM domain-containing protein [Flavobacterium sp. MFBS3-15]|uniref:2TM domain-containing protein n=1 Tax=Flavobacterium sp. MFBS3-15 TaxID=2989816 RepID=UPI002236B4AE|nr:2TM domain-containing protein [Flavobacterium sp. MFBS3-15]MCW4470574.1 2TM domain-containing protein [Flavobacterium sp. MFBS3-15]
MEELFEKASYDRARKRINMLKDFYRHILTFITVNVLTFVAGLIGFGLHPAVWYNCLIGTLLVGSLTVFANAVVLFGPQLIYKKGWEQQKMLEIIEEEERKNKTNKK